MGKFAISKNVKTKSDKWCYLYQEDLNYNIANRKKFLKNVFTIKPIISSHVYISM